MSLQGRKMCFCGCTENKLRDEYCQDCGEDLESLKNQQQHRCPSCGYIFGRKIVKMVEVEDSKTKKKRYVENVIRSGSNLTMKSKKLRGQEICFECAGLYPGLILD